MARYGMDYRNTNWNPGGMGHDYSERGYTGSGNRNLDRGDWTGRRGMYGNPRNRGDRGDEGAWGGYGGYEGDFGGRGTYRGRQGGEGYDRSSLERYGSEYGRSGFRGGSGEWRGTPGYYGGGRLDRWSEDPGLRGGYRGRGMNMDEDRDLGDRMREGWHGLKRGARDMLGGGPRGYDRNW